MPMPSQLAFAAASFRQNANLLEKSYSGIQPSEWLLRPNQTTNSLLWIAGHLVWARSMVLRNLEQTWTRPWFELFARGSAIVEPEKYPAPEEVLAAWADISQTLGEALDNAPEEVIAKPANPPSLDGTRAGMIAFLAYHETYHVGQAAYLRRWLGHEGVVG